MEESMRKRLEATKARYGEIETELSKPDIAENVKKLTDLSKERASLQEPPISIQNISNLKKKPRCFGNRMVAMPKLLILPRSNVKKI
jgi:protein subunit release factor A